MATPLSSTTPNDVERAVGFVNVLFTSSFFKPWKKRFLRLTVYPTLATLTMHKSPTVPSLGLLTLTPASTVRLLDHKGRTCLRIESDESVDHPDVWFVNPNTTDEIARWLDALRNAISTVQRSARSAHPADSTNGSSQGIVSRQLPLYPTTESFGGLAAPSQQRRRASDSRPGSPDSMVFPESVVDLSPEELAASSIGHKNGSASTPSGSAQPLGPHSGGASMRTRSDLSPNSPAGPPSTLSSSQAAPPPRSLPPQVPPPCLPPNIDAASSPNLAKRGLPRSISTPHLDRTNVPPPRSNASTRPLQPPPVPSLASSSTSMSQRVGPTFPNPRRPPPLQPSPSPSVDESMDATDQVLANYGFATMPSPYRPPWTANDPGAQGGPSAASSPTTTLNSMPDIPSLPPRPPSPHGSTPSPKTYVRDVASGAAQASNRFSGERGLNPASQRFSGERGLMSGSNALGRPGSPRSRAREISRSESPGSMPGSLDRAGVPPPSSASASATPSSSGLAGSYSPMRRALPLHDNQPRSPQQAHFGRQHANGSGGPISAPPPPATHNASGSSPLRPLRSDSPADSQYTAMASDLSSSVQPTATHPQQYAQHRHQAHSHASDPMPRSGYNHSTMPTSVRSTAATVLSSAHSPRANNNGDNGGESGQGPIPARNRSLYPQDQDVTRAQRLRDRMNMVGARENAASGTYSGASSLASTPTSSSMSLHSSPTPMGPSPASSNPASPLAPHRDADRQFPPQRQAPVQQQASLFEQGSQQRTAGSQGNPPYPRQDQFAPSQQQQHQIRDLYRYDTHVQQYPQARHPMPGVAQRQQAPRAVEYAPPRY